MGIYSGWDALGLGRTVSEDLRQRRRNEQDIIDRFGGILPALGEAFDDSVRRKRTLELADGIGIENAGLAANAMSGDEFLKYVLGEKSRKDAEVQEAKAYDRNRRDALADYGMKRRDEALDRGFGAVAQNYQVAMTAAQGDIPTAAELERYESAKRAYEDFIRAHPEYGARAAEMGLPSWGGVPFRKDYAPEAGTPKRKSLEDFFAELDGVMDGDTASAEKIQALKESLVRGNLWATLSANPDYAAKWNLYVSKIPGDSATRDTLSLGTGSVRTEGDAKRKKLAQDRAARLAEETRKLEAAARAGKYYDPTEYLRLGGSKGTKWFKNNENNRKKREARK